MEQTLYIKVYRYFFPSRRLACSSEPRRKRRGRLIFFSSCHSVRQKKGRCWVVKEEGGKRLEAVGLRLEAEGSRLEVGGIRLEAGGNGRRVLGKLSRVRGWDRLE